MRILVLLLTLHSLSADSFLERLLRYQNHTPAIQSTYIQAKLQRVDQEYTKWLSKVEDAEFMAHLKVSYFGGMLFQHLQTKAQDPALTQIQWIRQNYIELLKKQFAQMDGFIKKYFRSPERDLRVYELTLPLVRGYLENYQRFLQKTINADQYAASEAWLMGQLLSLPTTPGTKEMIRILMFLEFQLMEYGVSAN